MRFTPEAPTSAPLLEVRGLTKTFKERRGWPIPKTVAVRALDGVSFDVAHSEALGIVGESGCGKSTVARACLRLIAPDAGSVRFDGIDVAAASPSAMRMLRRRLQIVFQDPASALDPRQRIADAIGESIRVHGIARGNDVTTAVAAPARRGRPAVDRGAPLSARVLGRPAPAHRHRARARARPGPRLRRRAGVGARRQRAGADPGAARRAAPSPQARLRVHLARPRRGAPLLPAGRRDVPRPAGRGRPGADDLRGPAAPVHAAAEVVVADPRSGARGQRSTCRRASRRRRSIRRRAATSTRAVRS